MIDSILSFFADLSWSDSWSWLKQFLGDGKTIAIIVSVSINVWLFFVRPLRAKTFLAGQWSGQLTDDRNCKLSCIAVFYIEKGALRGHFHYEGIDYLHKPVKGFDELQNDLRHFRSERQKGKISIFPNRFAIDLSRRLHIIDDQTKSKPVAELYEFRFDIIQRFRHPRLECKVSFQPSNEGNEEVELVGQFSKLSNR